MLEIIAHFIGLISAGLLFNDNRMMNQQKHPLILEVPLLLINFSVGLYILIEGHYLYTLPIIFGAMILKIVKIIKDNRAQMEPTKSENVV